MKIALNCLDIKKNEVSVYTIDVGTAYKPDYNFSFLREKDFLKREEKQRLNLLKLKNVSCIRCDDFVQKLVPCEAINLFKIFYEVLEVNCRVIISVPDYYAYSKKLLEIKNYHYKKIYSIEKKIFTISDPTGIYYNKTIWTHKRLERCLNKANFNNVKFNYKEKRKYKLSIIATK